jgi:hypothetical protein
MKCRKTYGIPGLNNAVLYFKTGNVNFKVEFNGGSSRADDRPASFSTADPAVQGAIEKDSRFINGVVKLVSIYPLEEETPAVVSQSVPQQTQAPAMVAPAASATVVEDVIDINGVRDYLKNVLGVKPQCLNQLSSIKKKVQEYNLVFPNVVFE